MPPGSSRNGYAVPAGSPSVEETKDPHPLIRRQDHRRAVRGDSLPGEAITPASSGSPRPSPTRRRTRQWNEVIISA
jgi:hypothetical protein